MQMNWLYVSAIKNMKNICSNSNLMYNLHLIFSLSVQKRVECFNIWRPLQFVLVIKIYHD